MGNPSVTRNKVVLVPFPFDDLSTAKVRPAVCLTDPIGLHRRVVLAFISSQVPTDLQDANLVMDAGRADFARTGLHVSSTLRLHRLLTVSTSIIQGELGELSPALQVEVVVRLRKLFGL